jgi:hypothetical protein
MLEAVSALRNSVASKDLAESSGVWFLDRGNCEAKNPLVETENQCSLSNEGPLRLGTYTWRLDRRYPACWSGTPR